MNVGQVVLTPASVAVGGAIPRIPTIVTLANDTITNIAVTYASDNAAVARVSSAGVVTGVKEGSAVIRATAGGVSGTSAITVVDLAFVDLDVGSRHACARTAVGVTYCWGDNSVAQLGQRTNEDCLFGSCSTTPVASLTATGLAKLAVGSAHACVLGTDGVARCWGRNSSAELGAASSETCTSSVVVAAACSHQPLAVGGGVTFTTLDSGGGHTCGLRSNGEAWCWGNAFSGQLGSSPGNSSLVPVLVSGGVIFTAISAGVSHTCGLAAAGAAWCWGENASGQLGAAGSGGAALVSVSSAVAFVAISAGSSHTCALATSGAAWCWGSNQYGQLGDGTPATNSATTASPPVLVAGGLSFTSISAGSNHTCGLTLQGAAYCWGRNTTGPVADARPQGQLGDGTSQDRVVPTLVARGLTFAQIAAGTNFTCGRTSTGRAYCWGNGGWGQMGDGDMGRVRGNSPYRLSPVGVAGVP